MSIFWRRRPGIVNVRMVITEEKILSNIDKIQKLINPNSKKQIVQLDDDAYFKDLIDSVKTYLNEYPNKKNFPASVYKAAYGLVEYATNQFEENTKKIEDLIIQREKNVELAMKLKEILSIVANKEKDWKNQLKASAEYFQEDIIETLEIIGRCKGKTSQNYNDALKLINARISNLESNLHIEIDMERIEDRSKALSFIGIEVADALKGVPTPVEEVVEEIPAYTEEQQYISETTFEVKPSLWQRIKQSKIVRTMTYVFKIRVRLELPDALPEGRG